MLVFPFFNEKKVTDKIKEVGTLQKIPKNTIVYEQGTKIDKIYFISVGMIKQSILSECGKEKLVTIEKAGSIFGQGPIFRDLQTPTSVITLEDTELYYLEKNKILKLIKNDENFSVFLIRNMADKAFSATKQIESYTFNTPKERILELFKELCTFEYSNDKEWVKLNISLSHDKIANILGINRVTVSKVMADLRDEGILKSSREEFWFNTKYVE